MAVLPTSLPALSRCSSSAMSSPSLLPQPLSGRMSAGSIFQFSHSRPRNGSSMEHGLPRCSAASDNAAFLGGCDRHLRRGGFQEASFLYRRGRRHPGGFLEASHGGHDAVPVGEDGRGDREEVGSGWQVESEVESEAMAATAEQTWMIGRDERLLEGVEGLVRQAFEGKEWEQEAVVMYKGWESGSGLGLDEDLDCVGVYYPEMMDSLRLRIIEVEKRNDVADVSGDDDAAEEVFVSLEELKEVLPDEGIRELLEDCFRCIKEAFERVESALQGLEKLRALGGFERMDEATKQDLVQGAQDFVDQLKVAYMRVQLNRSNPLNQEVVRKVNAWLLGRSTNWRSTYSDWDRRVEEARYCLKSSNGGDC